jgi:hypothetical protein
MKVDPLDTDATMAGRQRSRCDAQETWMSQVAAGRHLQLAAHPCRHRPTTPGTASRFPSAPLRTARRRLVKARTKRFCGNGLEYTLSAT